MLRRLLSLFLVVSFLLLPQDGSHVTAASSQLSRHNIPPLPAAWGKATVAAWNSNTNTPSFVSGIIPLAPSIQSANIDIVTRAQAFLTAEGAIFGITNAADELVASKRINDQLGLQHVTFQQVYQGIHVYNAQLRLHMNQSGDAIVAMSSGFIPNISLATVEATQSVDAAVARAQGLLPGGTLVEAPQLTIYPGGGSRIAVDDVRLSWIVTLYDTTIPTRNMYVIDASNGQVIDLIETLHVSRRTNQLLVNTANNTVAIINSDYFGCGSSEYPCGGDIADHGTEGLLVFSKEIQAKIQTYNAQNNRSLPGTLIRSDDDPATGDRDVDDAHDFARAVYNYFLNTHNRESFDGQGATIVSTVHYGRNFMNAFWDGKQMVYGDGYTVRDVVAHELTHAITNHTANLEYRWQSGALNESFSDIFGVMVDRSNWTLGEDLSSSALGGREAIRDMADPARFGQPAHTNDWVETCSDHEGVHTNSGIFNKAYYNIATAIGKDKAEQIFFRALTVYLQPTSSFADARAKVLQATKDIYATETATYRAIENGFANVGLTADWHPDTNSCSCAAVAAVTADGHDDLNEKAATVSAFQVVSTLYDVRDELLSKSVVGQHYRDLYYNYTAQINLMLLFHSDLRGQGANLLRVFTPGMNDLVNADGDEVVTAAMVSAVDQYLADLKTQALEDGYTDLATKIEREQTRLDLAQLVGKSFAEAWEYINATVQVEELFIPIVNK